MSVWGQHNSAEVQQCRKKISSTVPKSKTFFNSAEKLNKLEDIKSHQKLNGDRVQFYVTLCSFEHENLQFRHFGAKIIVLFAFAPILTPKLE